MSRKKGSKNLIEIDKNEYNKENIELKNLEEIVGNYVINSDNFIKMVLIYYRIKANIPVIIMGKLDVVKLL